MAKINIEEARKLAKLSRLEFSEDELKNFVAEFDKTLEQVATIEKVDVSKVSLIENTLKSDIELRSDIVEPSFTQKEILANAPEQKDGAFVVPITVE